MDLGAVSPSSSPFVDSLPPIREVRCGNPALRREPGRLRGDMSRERGFLQAEESAGRAFGLRAWDALPRLPRRATVARVAVSLTPLARGEEKVFRCKHGVCIAAEGLLRAGSVGLEFEPRCDPGLARQDVFAICARPAAMCRATPLKLRRAVLLLRKRLARTDSPGLGDSQG